MKTLTVNLGDRSYPIFIGKGLLDQPELILPYIHGKQVMVITNKTIAPLYLKKTLSLFSAHQCHHLILPDGEAYKNLETFNQIIDELLLNKCDRSTTLVALGGGVIGDLTGFAAACYQRGIPFIQIPTTLLAQVDSSVGGKTGVNHALGKNMIGVFYQPKLVVVDLDTLESLPEKEYRAGLAEIIKYGVIEDVKLFEFLERQFQNILSHDSKALEHIIATSCAIKARVVEKDERESHYRMVLNFGHTIGHAIESLTGYSTYTHGEAACPPSSPP